jgi:small-conductance mechanosensitive channel
LNASITNLIWPAAAFATALVVMLALRHLLARALRKRIQDPHSFPFLLMEGIRVPSFLWSIAAAIVIAIRNSDSPPAVHYWAARGVGTFLILSVAMVMATIFVRSITSYGSRRQIPFVVAGLSQTLIRVFVFSLAGLMILRLFNISITPLLTALGVGGLAVALALQDTLANFFAGVHLLVEQPILVGDPIKLSSGEEGTVQDIGWRTTRIQTGQNSTIVIPNTKITSGILTNFNMPDRRAVSEIAVLVDRSSDPTRVRDIVLELAAATPGVLKQPPPVALFDPGITLTHMQWKLLFSVSSTGEQGGVQSAIRLGLLERFRAEGIALPTAPGTVMFAPSAADKAKAGD